MKRIFTFCFVFIYCLSITSEYKFAFAEVGGIDCFYTLDDCVRQCDNGEIPEWVKVRQDWKLKNSVLEASDDKAHQIVMSLKRDAEPAVSFDKVVNSGKMHIGFDVMFPDILPRRLTVGFYDGRNDSDPASWGADEYSKSIYMMLGKVYYYSSKWGNSSDDMTGWSTKSTNFTYKAGEWHNVGMVFDFDKQSAKYYFDGQLVNIFEIGTTDTKGLKCMFLRCELPKKDTDGVVSEDEVSEEDFNKYLETNDSCKVDNIRISTYTNSPELECSAVYNKNETNSLNLVFSEYVNSLTKDNITVTDSDGNDVSFEFQKKDSHMAQLDFSEIKYDTEYIISVKGAKGQLTGAANECTARFSFNGVLFEEDFENKNSLWSLNDGEELVYGEGKQMSQGLRMKSEFYEKNVLSAKFKSPVTESVFTAEVNVKADGSMGGFDIGIIKSDMSVQQIVHCNSGTYKLGYHPASGGSVVYPEALCKLTNPSKRWNKVSFTINKQTGDLEVMTGSGKISVKQNYELGDVYGIAITQDSGINKIMLVDNVRILGEKDKIHDDIFFYNTASEIVYGAEFDGGVLKQGRYCLIPGESTVDDGGIRTWTTNMLNGSMGIDITPKTVTNYENENNLFVEVTYLDDNYGWFALDYADKTSVKNAGIVCLQDTGEIKTHTFKISGAVMNEGAGNYDLQIRSHELEDNEICSDTDLRFSKHPIYIEEVRGYVDGTKSPYDISIKTNNTGNIFYDLQVPEFEISIKNTTEQEYNAEAYVRVYEYNENMSKMPISTQIINLQDLESDTFKIEADVERFGLYCLEIEIIDSEGVVDQKTEVPFSKCVGNDKMNYNIGAASHFTRYGDAQMGMELLKKAGIGNERDDFAWAQYERVKGERKLSERQEALLDAAIENGIHILPLISCNNVNYDSTNSAYINGDILDDFHDFVYTLLSEPKMKKVGFMVDSINEPENKHTLNGESIKDDYSAKACAAAGIIKEVYTAAKEADEKYQVGMFSSAGIAIDEIKGLADEILNEFKGEKYFDIWAMHPYLWGEDAEKGHFGEDSSDPHTDLTYQINYYRSLMNGTDLYNPVSGAYEKVSGIKTGNTYSFNNDNPMWHTEFGYSTAKKDNDSSCVGSETEQARRLIRGYNIIKENNFDDKVWIYDLADDGLRINEKEHGYGILHSYEYEVPYAAKYSYLAVSAYNKLTENAVLAENIYDNGYAFITEYVSDDRNVYMCWSTNGTQLIERDFGDNIRYYDLVGNPLNADDVMNDGKYIFTETPFYAVCGSEYSSVFADEVRISFEKNGLQYDKVSDISGCTLNIKGVKSVEDGILYVCVYQDNMLKKVDIKTENYTLEGNEILNMFSEVNYNKLKILFLDSNLRPWCRAAEIAQ